MIIIKNNIILFSLNNKRYIQPMRAGRLLDSPRHAARFVSLLPFEKDEAIGSGKYVINNNK